METFPQHHQLQKNVLLTICSDRILQDVSSYSYTADQQMASLVEFSNCKFGHQYLQYSEKKKAVST